MPELPEVETVVRSIRPLIVGKTIKMVETAVDYPKVLATHAPAEFNRLIRGQSIVAARRRGKYIVLELNSGYLLIHLRMTGRLLARLGPEDKSRHITATIVFSDRSKLYFKDYRKFGRFYYSDSLDFLEDKLGIEPLGGSFTAAWLINQLKESKRKVKPLLLDQSFIAGLGNIYVDEALWAANIHPEISSNRISVAKIRKLHSAIREILRVSIEHNGTTIINFAFGDNSTGEFVNQLQVFDRKDHPCPRCQTPITKTRVAQRGTYLCPKCQKL